MAKRAGAGSRARSGSISAEKARTVDMVLPCPALCSQSAKRSTSRALRAGWKMKTRPASGNLDGPVERHGGETSSAGKARR